MTTRVTVNSTVDVCPDGHFMRLTAGQSIEGPVAEWLIDASGCDITIDVDDRTAHRAGADDAQEPTEGDGSLSADLQAAADTAAGAGKSGQKGK